MIKLYCDKIFSQAVVDYRLDEIEEAPSERPDPGSLICLRLVAEDDPLLGPQYDRLAVGQVDCLPSRELLDVRGHGHYLEISVSWSSSPLPTWTLNRFALLGRSWRGRVTVCGAKFTAAT